MRVRRFAKLKWLCGLAISAGYRARFCGARAIYSSRASDQNASHLMSRSKNRPSMADADHKFYHVHVCISRAYDLRSGRCGLQSLRCIYALGFLGSERKTILTLAPALYAVNKGMHTELTHRFAMRWPPASIVTSALPQRASSIAILYGRHGMCAKRAD